MICVCASVWRVGRELQFVTCFTSVCHTCHFKPKPLIKEGTLQVEAIKDRQPTDRLQGSHRINMAANLRVRPLWMWQAGDG